jgi:hypothetical protein
MPDPIASGSARKQESSYDDAVCREEPKAVTAPAKTAAKPATSSEPKPAVVSHEDVIAKLPTHAFDYSLMARPGSKPPVTSPSAPTNTNAERTTARESVGPYLAAGVTSSGDSEFVAAALLKGRNSESGIEAEVLSGSVQRGFQNEAQVGLLRVGASRADGTSSGIVDAFAARAAIGIHNSDGSTGFNIALTATALGVEGTHRASRVSFTGGVGLGVGGEVSVGVRDADHDGKKELCVRIGGGPGTVGHCIEKPW